MSAALEDVPRGDGDLAEVTSLEGAVRACLDLDPKHKVAATLIAERPVQISPSYAPTLTALRCFGSGVGLSRIPIAL